MSWEYAHVTWVTDSKGSTYAVHFGRGVPVFEDPKPEWFSAQPIHVLNELGRAGWELVSESQRYLQGVSTFEFWLKRPR